MKRYTRKSLNVIFMINGNRYYYLKKIKEQKIEKGKLLNFDMKCLISGWIDRKFDIYNDINNLSHRFELILQGTRDGFSRSIFENKCYNIEQTVVIMKIKGTDEFVGGYN